MTSAPEEPGDLSRLLMERARAQAERDRVREPRRTVPMILAGIAAIGLVALVLLGFDAFLTSMQKFLEIEVTEPEPRVTDPMPAFVVTDETQGAQAEAEPAAPAARDE